jgi:hypothetical protein
VAEEIVPAEGLLNHHEVVGVHLFEKAEIFFAISGIGIDRKLDIGKFLADAGDAI